MKKTLIAFVLIFSQFILADEGMWLLNKFPSEKVEKKIRL